MDLQHQFKLNISHGYTLSQQNDLGEKYAVYMAESIIFSAKNVQVYGWNFISLSKFYCGTSKFLVGFSYVSLLLCGLLFGLMASPYHFISFKQMLCE